MESIGQQLRHAREAQGSSISQAAAATRIKFQYIESMESDDFSNIAAAAYARGFIKIYADYLGIDPGPLIGQYEQQHAPESQRRTAVALESEPASPAGARPSAAGIGIVGAGSENNQGPGPAAPRRWVVPAAGALLMAAVALWLWRGQDSDAPVGGSPAADLEPLRLADPPDSYLALPEPERGAP